MTLLANSNDFQALRELHIQINTSGMITLVSPNCYEILGFTSSELLNTYLSNYISYNIHDLLTHVDVQIGVCKKNGERLFFDIVSKPLVDVTSNFIGAHLSLINISKYINIQEQYNHFVKLFEKARDLVFKYQLIPERKFIYLSPSVSDIFGYAREEYFINPNLTFELIHPDDILIQQSKTDKHSDFSKNFCTRFKHKDGHYIWIEDYLTPTFDDNGNLISVEGISRDITERKILEEKLEELSYRDGLTGLYNRTYLNKQIEMLTDDDYNSVSVIACDLDNLKYINDSLGHSTGDLLIKKVSNFFRGTFSENCILVRNGGDEFIILIPKTSLKEAKEMYSRMLCAIEDYNITNEMTIELSSGFAYSSSSKDILELLSKADKYMYKNKYEKRETIDANKNRLVDSIYILYKHKLSTLKPIYLALVWTTLFINIIIFKLY